MKEPWPRFSSQSAAGIAVRDFLWRRTRTRTSPITPIAKNTTSRIIGWTLLYTFFGATFVPS